MTYVSNFVKTTKRCNLDYIAEQEENDKLKSKKHMRDLKRNRGGKYFIEVCEDNPSYNR
jgi:hypothetical protein